MTPPADAMDMSSLPTPVYDGFPLHAYLSPDVVLNLASSRRCYWDACTFCSMSPPRSGPRHAPASLRDAELLVADVEEMHGRYGARCFFFSDQAVAPAVLSRFSERILDRGLDILWYCFARFERSFDGAFCRKLADAGCRRLLFGLEAGNPRVNGLLNKGVDLEHARRVVGHCRDAGISIDVSCIVGFPGETEAEAQDTAAFFLDNAGEFGAFTTFAFHPFTLMRDSQVHRTPEAFGVEVDSDEDLGPFCSATGYRAMAGLDQERARSLCQSFRVTVGEALRDKTFFAGLDYDTHTLFYVDRHRRERAS